MLSYTCIRSFKRCTVVTNIIMHKKAFSDFPYVHLVSQSKLVGMLRFFVPLVKNGEALMNLIKILIEGRQQSQPH